MATREEELPKNEIRVTGRQGVGRYLKYAHQLLVGTEEEKA
jgi:hypothetical protein